MVGDVIAEVLDYTAEGNSQSSFVQRRVLMAPDRFSAAGVWYSPPDVSFILEHTLPPHHNK